MHMQDTACDACRPAICSSSLAAGLGTVCEPLSAPIPSQGHAVYNPGTAPPLPVFPPSLPPYDTAKTSTRPLDAPAAPVDAVARRAPPATPSQDDGADAARVAARLATAAPHVLLPAAGVAEDIAMAAPPVTTPPSLFQPLVAPSAAALQATMQPRSSARPAPRDDDAASADASEECAARAVERRRTPAAWETSVADACLRVQQLALLTMTIWAVSVNPLVHGVGARLGAHARTASVATALVASGALMPRFTRSRVRVQSHAVQVSCVLASAGLPCHIDRFQGPIRLASMSSTPCKNARAGSLLIGLMWYTSHEGVKLGAPGVTH